MGGKREKPEKDAKVNTSEKEKKNAWGLYMHFCALSTYSTCRLTSHRSPLEKGRKKKQNKTLFISLPLGLDALTSDRRGLRDRLPQWY